MILKTVHLVETENVTNHNSILELHYILDTIMDVMLVIKSPQQTPVLAMWTRAMGKMLLPHLAVTSRLMNQGSLQKKSGTLRESSVSTTSTTENEYNLNLYMFGLQGGYLGRRDRQIRLQGHLSELDKHAVLQRAIREAWPDFINEDTQYFIPIPQPDPEEHGDGAHLYVLVNFLARQLSQHNGLVPVLFEAKGWDLDLNLIQHTIEAAMVPERAHWSMLSSACGLHQAVFAEAWQSVYNTHW